MTPERVERDIREIEAEAGRQLLWLVAEDFCVFCGRRNRSVFPSEVIALECDGCGKMNPVPRETQPYQRPRLPIS